MSESNLPPEPAKTGEEPAGQKPSEVPPEQAVRQTAHGQDAPATGETPPQAPPVQAAAPTVEEPPPVPPAVAPGPSAAPATPPDAAQPPPLPPAPEPGSPLPPERPASEPGSGLPSIPPAIPTTAASVPPPLPPPLPDAKEIPPVSLKPPAAAPVPEPAAPARLERPAPKRVTAEVLDRREADRSFWDEVESAVKDSLEHDPSAEAVRKLTDELTAALSKPKHGLLAFGDTEQPPEQKFIDVDDGRPPTRLWMIGDLHGDVLGLQTVLAYVDGVCGADPENKPSFLFIGDLFDRGEYGHLVLYSVLRLIVQEPGRHAFIVGNHDEGLRLEKDGTFSSSVQPCEFAQWLNRQPPDSAWRPLAAAAIRFFEAAPRAILLSDGLLAAHGGVPHVDRQEAITSLAALSAKPMLEDFVWTRLHESAKRKIPNRTTRGCSLGFEDFNAFCAQATKALGRPVLGMVRGHDHLEPRYAFFEKYRDHPVLTINTMCCRLEGEMFGEYHRPAIVAEWESGRMPLVHEIEVPAQLVERIYPNKHRTQEAPL